MIEATSTLRSIALAQPTTIRVFERFHLDYCCGGKRSLADACVSTGLNTEEVVAALQLAVDHEHHQENDEDLTEATPTAIIRHIVEKHHAYVKAEIPRLLPLAERVVTRHGANHPEVIEIAHLLGDLANELIMHLRKEETILFPYIEALDRQRGGNAAAEACFGSVESPIRAMVAEHEQAGNLLAAIRSLSSNFTPPAGACPTYAGLFDGLAAFERDLHQHIHLENNLLFPRAIGLERDTLAAY